MSAVGAMTPETENKNWREGLNQEPVGPASEPLLGSDRLPLFAPGSPEGPVMESPTPPLEIRCRLRVLLSQTGTMCGPAGTDFTLRPEPRASRNLLTPI